MSSTGACALGAHPQALDNGDRRPAAKLIFGSESLRKRLAGVNASGHEHGIEAHPRGAEYVSLQAVADRQHRVRRRIARN